MAFGLFSRSLAMKTDTIRKARELSQFDGNSALAWTFLRESYLVNSASTRLRLRTELHNLRMVGGESLDCYKDRIIVLNSKYQSVNNNVGFGDEELISTLLYGLDQRFETIVNVIEQIDADALVWADIVRRLKNYENLKNNNHQPKSYNTTTRMANAKEDSSAPMLMTREQWRISESKTNFHPIRNNNRRNNNNNRNRTNSNTSAKSQAKWCNFHKVNTHSDQECFFQNRRSSNNNPRTNSRNNIIRNNNNNTEDMDTCLMLKCVQSPNISKKCSNSHSSSFYIDSAASKSYISNLNLFDSFTNKIGTTNVEIGDGSIISTNGIGNIGIFDQIFYGSNLAFNILSVYDLSRHGLHVEFFGNFCRILDGYKTFLLQISRGSDNLFSINIDQVRELSSILESKLSDISAKSEFINSPTSNLASNDLQNPEIENSISFLRI